MKKIKPVCVVISVLVLLTAIAAAVHFATRTDVPEGTLRVEYGDKAMELDVSKLELVPVQGAVRNGRAEVLSVAGQGILLNRMLEQAGVGEYTAVTVTADDEYSAVVTAAEAAEPDRVYLLIEEDGSLRLVVFGDENSKRNVSNVKLVSVS